MLHCSFLHSEGLKYYCLEKLFKSLFARPEAHAARTITAETIRAGQTPASTPLTYNRNCAHASTTASLPYQGRSAG